MKTLEKWFQKLAMLNNQGMGRIKLSIEWFFMMLRLNRSVNLVKQTPKISLFQGLKYSSL
eukprot:snap_masked-scaffold_26-processed-gene-3.58-mRNA-1 protein AED:1.00 eAED:1.00 QI:0/0/0/0/1/1/2/0/59